jgi:hypothetical protein
MGLAACMLLLTAQSALADVVTVSVDSYEIPSGTAATVTVDCTDVTDLGVIACDIVLEYSGAVVLYVDGSATRGSVWLSGFISASEADGTGDQKILTIAIASFEDAIGSGTLAEVELLAVGPEGAFTNVSVDCVLNEGDPETVEMPGSVLVTQGGSGVDSDSDLAPELDLIVPSNPCRQRPSLQLQLAETGPVSLRFVDAQGRVIWGQDARMADGQHWIHPSFGGDLATGIYYWVARQGDVTRRSKVVLLK